MVWCCATGLGTGSSPDVAVPSAAPACSRTPWSQDLRSAASKSSGSLGPSSLVEIALEFICYHRGEYCADLSKRDSDPKTVRSNLSIPGVNRKGLRVPILTFTRGYSNGKIFRFLSVLFASGAPGPLCYSRVRRCALPHVSS